MTLEQSVQHALHFTSANGYETEKIPSDALTKPYELTLEPNQHPFFLTPTSLFGYSNIVRIDQEPYRKVVLGLYDLGSTNSYKRLGRNAEQIPTYATTAQALDDLALRGLPHQQENTAKFFQNMQTKTHALCFSAGNYHGQLSFVEGSLVAAVVKNGTEELRGKLALPAFFLLNAYVPLSLSSVPLNQNNGDFIGAGINAINASALPALGHTFVTQLNAHNPLGTLLFNVTEKNGRLGRAGNPTYALGIAYGERPLGLFRFKEGRYADGVIRTHDGTLTGDYALQHALRAARTMPELRATRLDLPKLFERDVIGTPARNSVLHATAYALVGPQ